MKLTLLACIILCLLPAFGLAYWLVRRLTKRPIERGPDGRLAVGRGVLTVGDTVDITVTLRNTGRRTIPLLKTELTLPDGLTFADTHDRSLIGLFLLRPGQEAVLHGRLLAYADGDYTPDAIRLLGVGCDPLGQGVFSRAIPLQTVSGGLSDSVLLRVRPSSAEATIPQPGAPQPGAAPKTPAADSRREARRLCRTAKFLACAGITALLMLPLQLCFTWGARQYAPVAALLLTPLLVALGYGIQYLLLSRQQRQGQVDEWDFSYESGRLRVPALRVIAACLLTALPSAAVGVGVSRLTVHLLRNEPIYANEEVGVPLIIAGCIIAGVVGCLLLPFKFQQLLSVRTSVECMAPIVFLFGVQLFWGNGIDLWFVLCVLFWLLCLCVCMNREAVLKTYLTAETTGQIPAETATLTAFCRAEIPTIGGLWLLTLLIDLPLAALCLALRAGILFIILPPLIVYLVYRKARRARATLEQ